MTGTTVVVAATPTPNGDLHVGHLAGPYLAADVYARSLRARGERALYVTCTDDSQSYVVTTARRQGGTPEALCALSTAQIAATMEAVGIDSRGLPPVDGRYRRTVSDFVTGLHAAGRLRSRLVRVPVTRRGGQVLYDAFVSGTCPQCLGGSSGGACEACGHPNLFDQLVDARSTVDSSDPVAYEERRVLVLPMEEHRARLEEHYAGQLGNWRPHARQLVHELLARPLPDVPVTMPGSWGIPAPFAETPGQVLYPWVEAMPAIMYGTWWAAGADPGSEVDALWRDESTRPVFFHGFDNVYHWAFMDLAMLLAHGDRYVLPVGSVCNEFYDLDGEKFSTSRGHLIGGRELVAEVPRDLVRYHLALTAPESQRTNFTRASLRETTERTLVGPWNRLAEQLDTALARPGLPRVLPTSLAGRTRSVRVAERFRVCYELADFSVARAAETLAAQVGRLAAAAVGCEPYALGDLLLETRTLLAGAAPILVDAAATAGAAGVELDPARVGDGSVPAFRLPLLAAAVAGAPAR